MTGVTQAVFMNHRSFGIPAEIWTWGNGSSGQLAQGLYNNSNFSSPVQIGALTNWNGSISGGQDHRLVVKSNGQLWAWGSRGNGQLGDNSTAYPPAYSPIQIGSLSNWSQVSACINSSLAVKTDGTLWAWGQNNSGQLGINSTSGQSSPVQIGALTNWSQVAGGNSHVLAIKTDGTLWSWGYNASGQLGLNDTINRSSPVQVGALTTWSKVACGQLFSLAIKTDGTLWSWGRNYYGQLGLGVRFGNRSSPVQVGALTTWADIAGGNEFSAAVQTDGTLWAWGLNGSGQLGQDNTINRSSPVQVGALTTWSKVACGTRHVLVIATGKQLWSFGYGFSGQLGVNIAANRSSPVQVGALTTWLQIAKMSEANASLALKS